MLQKSSKAEINPHSLEGVALFSRVEARLRTDIEERCDWRSYEPGATIVNHLDKTDDVFFIVAGEVRVTIYSLSGKAVSFCDLGPGDMFGEYAAIDRQSRSANVQARSICLVASMPGASFLKLLETQPSVTHELLLRLVNTIRALDRRVYEFSTLAVNNRIRAEVLRLANLFPRKGRCASIAPAPTHAEIASRVSTHREAVTREFTRLTQLGILERQGHTLLVKDVDRLKAIVHDSAGEADQ
jgi:CRP/FNR family cyclic AMP-dependent transcriptional regulator